MRHTMARNATTGDDPAKQPTRLARRQCLWAGIAALTGCAAPRAPVVPVRSIADSAPCGVRPETLLVFLPGVASKPEEFEEEGFVRALRQRRVLADVVMVDLHRGYYDDRSVVDRLELDVLAPARAQGYRHVWLVGISLGAVGAALYAQARPGDVDGVVMIAPYLGKRSTAEALRDAGGLRSSNGDIAAEDDEIGGLLWRWLHARTRDDAATRQLPLFLAYGTEDRFSFNQQVLAEALPAGRVFTAPGNHDWPVWRALWPRVVDAMPLARDDRCRPPATTPVARAQRAL